MVLSYSFMNKFKLCSDMSYLLVLLSICSYTKECDKTYKNNCDYANYAKSDYDLLKSTLKSIRFIVLCYKNCIHSKLFLFFSILNVNVFSHYMNVCMCYESNKTLTLSYHNSQISLYHVISNYSDRGRRPLAFIQLTCPMVLLLIFTSGWAWVITT